MFPIVQLVGFWIFVWIHQFGLCVFMELQPGIDMVGQNQD